MSRITIAAAVIAAAVFTGSASAAKNAAAPITVKGVQTIVDEAKGKFEMKGDLVGAWNMTAFTPHYMGPDGQFVGSGKELFTGCRDANRNGSCEASEQRGTIRFTFIYWATYKPNTQVLLKGQCVHPVTGGTGAFAGVKGVIHMQDRPSPAGVKTTYTGTLLYAGAASASTNSLATRELASRSARHSCGA